MKITAYLAYLAAWLVFAIAALIGSLPRLRKGQTGMTSMPAMPVVIGTALQALAAMVMTRSMGSDSLRPGLYELAGAQVLAPLGAALFVWAVRSGPSEVGADKLITEGAYRWLRHPIYLAFLAMLVATGLLISAGVQLILAVLVYLAGSEFRIAVEERELARKFPEAYAQYRRRTRWRYLPGLR